MFELHRRNLEGADLSAERRVLDWDPQFSEPVELYTRVRVGSPQRPRAAASGTYRLRAFVGGSVVRPTSQVQAQAEDRQIWLISRPFVLDAGERLQIDVTGLAGDSDVDVQVLCYSAEVPAAYQSRLVPVDHNYGGEDALAYRTLEGTGVQGALVHAYLEADYDEGRRGHPYLHAVTRTAREGRWERPVMLYPESWVIVFYLPGRYGPDVARIRISGPNG